MEESLLNSGQCGFRPGDSFINHLLAITHEIFEAFDFNPSLEVRSVFSYISKAFDKVWHDGLLYKASPWVYQENFTVFLKAILQVDSKGLF